MHVDVYIIIDVVSPWNIRGDYGFKQLFIKIITTISLERPEVWKITLKTRAGLCINRYGSTYASNSLLLTFKQK